MSSALAENDTPFTPIEQTEFFLSSTDWPNKRLGPNEMVVGLNGNWCEYQITVSWDEISQLYQSAVSFNIGVARSGAKETELLRLLALLNENLYFGHFDLWREENAVVWRHAQFLETPTVSDAFLQKLFFEAPHICEKHYPAFQYVLWGEQAPEHALAAVLFETAGTA